MEKKLSVKNLKISFRTGRGKVQAVRNVSFSLDKGETLAIVGESGSGKSVTSRAILGILANNAIVEGGEIIYDGQDLLKITEEDFHKIRGDKIAMIFQDPLSSLDPIEKIGKQMTEAMLLKNKANRRASRRAFNATLRRLNENMDRASGDDEAAHKLNKERCAAFDSFEYVHIKYEQEYNEAYQAAEEAVVEIGNCLFEIEKNAFAAHARRAIDDVADLSLKAISRFVVREGESALPQLVAELRAQEKKSRTSEDFTALLSPLNEIKKILEQALQKDVPNFFGLGYYLKNVSPTIPEMPVSELNEMTHRELNERFMLSFIDAAQSGMKYSHDTANEKKIKALEVIAEKRETFANPTSDARALRDALRACRTAVEDSIDRMEIVKDSLAYTFGSSMDTELSRLINGKRKNARETSRYEKQNAKLEKLRAKGKDPGWKAVPADITDFDEVRENINVIIDNLVAHYGRRIADSGKYDPSTHTVEIIDYLKEMASNVVYKVTPRMAKNKAIKLMEEVGIPEPRKRYTQYPFQFSGGMRQRIVIAIALSANPDILICDEPTTALDVTIQAQILELINKLKKERNLTVIFITHDLGVVANMADRIAVMYAGKIVELGTTADVFYNPAHPYTWALLSSMPDLDTNEKLEAIPGTPPDMLYPPVGDAFAARNQHAMEIDFEEQPPMFTISETHSAATWLLHPDAPHVDPPKIVTDRIARMKKAEAEMEAEAKNNE